MDGTDWGLDDDIAKCGGPVPAAAQGQWFVFVRETD